MPNLLKSFSPLVRSMAGYILVAAAVIIALGAVFFCTVPKNPAAILPFSLGVMLTSLLNIVKIIWLERVVNKSVELEETKGANYIRVHYMLRFLFTGAVLVAAVYIPFVDLFGALLGVLTYKAGTLALRKASE